MRAPERRRPLRGLLAAMSFLTRVPLGSSAARVTEDDLHAGAAWFPLVGAVVGLGAASVGRLAAIRAPSLVAAALAVAAEVALTGAFHLDGLADTADGLGAASTGRDGLRAMREPTIGVFGAAALIVDLMLRVGATSALLAAPAFPWEIVSAAGAARIAPLALARWLPYLRPEGGSGGWIGDRLRTGTLAAGLACALALAALVGWAEGVAMLAALAAVTLVVGTRARRAFGGVTGDTLGAAAELSQTLALVTAVLVVGR